MLSHSMLRRTNLSAVSTEVFEYISEMVNQHLELLTVLEQSRDWSSGQMSLLDLPDNWALRAYSLQARKEHWSLWSAAFQCIAFFLGFDCLLNCITLYEIARLCFVGLCFVLFFPFLETDLHSLLYENKTLYECGLNTSFF